MDIDIDSFMEEFDLETMMTMMMGDVYRLMSISLRACSHHSCRECSHMVKRVEEEANSRLSWVKASRYSLEGLQSQIIRNKGMMNGKQKRKKISLIVKGIRRLMMMMNGRMLMRTKKRRSKRMEEPMILMMTMMTLIWNLPS